MRQTFSYFVFSHKKKEEKELKKKKKVSTDAKFFNRFQRLSSFYILVLIFLVYYNVFLNDENLNDLPYNENSPFFTSFFLGFFVYRKIKNKSKREKKKEKNRSAISSISPFIPSSV